ncbi:DotI/IcmL family type IV secretion protein [Legionella worsleiensis]|uniref:IcmL-like protein n=1 Tax=Legionella worsleiensis TaxID=45076 RepID=A0A0W1ALG5_9GAMM|nr:DotI/IcmL family type IV secretion protein [Legionella worsleiensis]KTD82126.1 IcmL-like protein [Legionella worsleiensis]STY31416.1 IcmL-like protein [Legionella worsleiensis]
MKKTMLWGALCTLLCTQIHADTTQQQVQSQNPNTGNVTVTTNPTTAVNQNTPPDQTTQSNQPTQQIQSNQTSQSQPNQAVSSNTEQTAQTINCNYKIPADVKSVDPTTVLNWSEQATTQAFDFAPASLDTQLQNLQACFTDQGWQGFNSALQKSGNIDAIKTQNLTVSSQIDGQAQITETSANQWKITLPLQVVYQNNKEKVTQLLNVNLTVGRKVSGDLGIMQLIATPRTPTAQQPANDANTTSTPAATTPASNTVNTQTTPVNPNAEVNSTSTHDSGTPTSTNTPTPVDTGTTPSPVNNGSNQQNPGTGTPPAAGSTN